MRRVHSTDASHFMMHAGTEQQTRSIFAVDSMRSNTDGCVLRTQPPFALGWQYRKGN